MNNSLQTRLNAMKLIENIMTVRGVLRKGKFDATMFEQVNGDDKALESLVGRDVVFAMLDDAGKVALRREIMNKLTENLIGTYGKLRESLENYFQDVDKSLESIQLADSDTALKNINKITDAYKAVLPGSTLELQDGTGCYTAVGVKNTLQAFNAVTEFITAITPVMARVYADAIEKEEDGTAEAAPIPAAQPGSEAAPPEKIEVEPETNDPDHQIFNPAQQDSDALGEITACANANRSMENCDCHFVRESGLLKDFGYATVENIVQMIKDITVVDREYNLAVENFRKVFPVGTCVQDDLACITDEMMTAVDAVMNLVRKAESIRKNLAGTHEQLLNVLQTLETAVA